MSGYECDLQKLSALLKVESSSEDSDDDLPRAGLSKIGPGHIGNKQSSDEKSKISIRGSSKAGLDSKKAEEGNDSDSIWHPDEISDSCTGEGHFDSREQPDYDIKYQQAVSSEDVYLQMGGKTTATASCENMVVTIKLLGESKKAVDLTVTRSTLEVRSPLYRLQLHLPHTINPDEGHATWDQTNQQLLVTLRMVREYDFINF